MIRATPSAALTSSIPQRAHLVPVEQPAPIVRKRVITSRIRKLSEGMSVFGCASPACAVVIIQLPKPRLLLDRCCPVRARHSASRSSKSADMPAFTPRQLSAQPREK
jgi:hypothetical protein